MRMPFFFTFFNYYIFTFSNFYIFTLLHIYIFPYRSSPSPYMKPCMAAL